ncbi:MAG: DUF1232 domain-containing protein [Calditrichaeota bacterium]|nr:MAG: DUF1232 domain-containing protein [Calditrichota bacterium]
MNFRSIFIHGVRNPAGFFKALLLLPKFIRLINRLLKDRRVPFFAKSLFLAACVYGLSPLDFLPEILYPVLGFTDDVLLIIISARYLFKSSPPEVLQAHIAAIEGKDTMDFSKTGES